VLIREELGEYMPFVLNNVDPARFTNIDLSELFGTEDSPTGGNVGRKDPGSGEQIILEWDWGPAGFKEVLMMLYMIKTGCVDGFEDFYQNEVIHREDLLENAQRRGILPTPTYMLYVMTFRVSFPVLILEIPRIRWLTGDRLVRPKWPILISFKPISYLILDNDRWRTINTDIRQPALWIDRIQNADTDVVEKFCKKMAAQHNFGLVPTETLLESLNKAHRNSTVYYSLVIVRKTTRDITLNQNQIFWSIFKTLTGKHHIRENLKRIESDITYSITSFTINAFTKDSPVYRQEYGVLKTCWKCLWDLLDDQYSTVEFSGQKTKTAKESKIIKRALTVSSIQGEENNPYSDCDYDIAIDLRPLGTDNVLLIPLTVGLWKKGPIPFQDYLAKWKELYYQIPKRHPDLTLLWYVAINQTEKEFFNDPHVDADSFEDLALRIKNHNQEIKPYEEKKETPQTLLGEIKIMSNSDPKQIGDNDRIIFLASFRKTPHSKNVEKELEHLLAADGKSSFEKTLRKLLEISLQKEE